MRILRPSGRLLAQYRSSRDRTRSIGAVDISARVISTDTECVSPERSGLPGPVPGKKRQSSDGVCDSVESDTPAGCHRISV